MVLCNQWCGTSVHFVNGEPYNDSNNRPHRDTCSTKIKAQEFEGYYNMIQIKAVREQLDDIELALSHLGGAIKNLKGRLDWQEEQNKPWAEAFLNRKKRGTERNYQQQKPEIKVASELLTK